MRLTLAIRNDSGATLIKKGDRKYSSPTANMWSELMIENSRAYLEKNAAGYAADTVGVRKQEENDHRKKTIWVDMPV